VLASRVIEDAKRIQKFLMEVQAMGKNLFLDLILEQGVAKGLQMGREEGRAEEARRNTLRVLKRRFGAAPSGIRAKIRKLDDLARLEAVLDHAVTCASLDEFRALL
jgi:predicted transposase YdaD